MNSYKVTVLGSTSVGKTCLIGRLIHSRFIEGTEPTIGASYSCYRKIDPVTGKPDGMTLNIWDTAGQERYHSIIPMYLRNTDVIIIVYDATKESSLYDVTTTWIPFIRSQKAFIPDHVIIYVVANKIDLCNTFEDREFIEKGRSFAIGLGYFFAETSAVRGTGVHQLFESIIGMIKQSGRIAYEAELDGIRLQERSASPKRGCKCSGKN